MHAALTRKDPAAIAPAARERDLVARASHGDAVACASIMRQHNRLLFRSARGVLLGEQEAVADGAAFLPAEPRHVAAETGGKPVGRADIDPDHADQRRLLRRLCAGGRGQQQGATGREQVSSSHLGADPTAGGA